MPGRRALAATVHRFALFCFIIQTCLRSPMASPSKGTGMEEHVIYLRHISSLATIVSFLPTYHCAENFVQQFELVFSLIFLLPALSLTTISHYRRLARC